MFVYLISSYFSLFFFLATVNVLVPHCKIYNDASCDISADGQLLAVFIPSSQRGFADEGILAVYSLAPHNLGEMLYTKRFGRCLGTVHQTIQINQLLLVLAVTQ